MLLDRFFAQDPARNSPGRVAGAYLEARSWELALRRGRRMR